MVASCEATADPPPVIQWFTGDTRLGVQNQSLEGVSIISSIYNVTTSSQLTVTGFTSNDTGVYSCVAVNALGNDSRPFQVNTVGESVKFHSNFYVTKMYHVRTYLIHRFTTS